jgi:indole-3-glycerol phosphate synthase
MPNILNLILESTRKKVETLRKNRDAFSALIKRTPAPKSFKDAIKRHGKLSVIGEIKQASPSRGLIKKEFSPVDIARIYSDCRVNALSVLTEEEFFLGKINYIEDIKKEVDLPVLRKDFIIDEAQILESRAAGADAILLIVRILDDNQLSHFYNVSKELGMDVLVEAHSEKELRKVLKLGADIIGINNRNLNTLKVDLARTQKLIPFVPADMVKVAESGVSSFKDMLWLKGLGVDAVLIGETFMRADNVAEKVRELHIDA